MIRKYFTLLPVLLCVLLLTGCGCSHEWKEADCTTPKICTKCDATEGEALGHSFGEATCAAPSTCAGCGITEGEALSHNFGEATCAAPSTCTGCGTTEGEALPHTWTEANFQAAKTCSICGAEEGEPLTPSFVASGYEIDVTEAGVSVPMEVAGTKYLFRVESYDIYASDAAHEALEGYEWRTVALVIEAQENQSALGTNVLLYPDYDDYYDSAKFNETLAQVPGSALLSLSHTVNYLGTDYPGCRFQLDHSNLDNGADAWAFEQTMSFRVPVGYDGIVVCVGDATLMNGDYNALRDTLYKDENTVIFRLS